MLPGNLLRQMHPSNLPAENDHATSEQKLYQIYLDHTPLASTMRPVAIQHHILMQIIRFYNPDLPNHFDYKTMKYFLERKGHALESIFGVLQRIKTLYSYVSNAVSLQSICDILIETNLLVNNGIISITGQNILQNLTLYCRYLNIGSQFTAEKFDFLVRHYHSLSIILPELISMTNIKIRLFVSKYLDKIEKKDSYYMVLLFAVLPEQIHMQELGWNLTIKELLNELMQFNNLTPQLNNNLNYFHHFLYLKKTVEYYTNRTPRVTHGLFTGQLPRNLREINAAIAKAYESESSFKAALEEIINFAAKLGANHPILRAANKLKGFDGFCANENTKKIIR